MVKGYIAGTRKEHNRLAQEAGDEGEHSGGGDSEKDNNPSNDDHPPPLKKKNTHSSSSKSNTSSTDSFVDEQNDHNSRPPARPRHKHMTTTTTTTTTTSKKHPPPISESNKITEEDDDQGLYEDDWTRRWCGGGLRGSAYNCRYRYFFSFILLYLSFTQFAHPLCLHYQILVIVLYSPTFPCKVDAMHNHPPPRVVTWVWQLGWRQLNAFPRLSCFEEFSWLHKGYLKASNVLNSKYNHTQE